MTSKSDIALAALLDQSNAAIVDMVLRKGADGNPEAHTQSGSVGFDSSGPIWSKGRNPFERTDPGAFSPLEQERSCVRPSNYDNAYPFAYDNIAHLFRNANAPDLAVVHTPAHNWEDKGGHRGEHGSCNVVQSRAPLIMAGAGIKSLGSVPRAARMVDITPTICDLVARGRPGGVPVARDLDGPMIPARSGSALRDIFIDEESPEHVVAFLCDGTNANVLYAMARAGELPNIKRLMDQGTVFEHGLIASFPSVTLANHTTALTGAHPGEHGILHNAYYDRSSNREILANSPATWHLARNELDENVPTLFEILAKANAGFTAAVNEPCDRGASYATFDAVRDGGEIVNRLQAALPNPMDVAHATKQFVASKMEYAWSTAADHMAVSQAVDLWSGGMGNPKPAFMWINLILNDAGNHAGGPYSDIGHAALKDTDGRIGAIMTALDWGAGNTAFVLLADHGMEESDPECVGDYSESLRAEGLSFRDEGFGFIYLDQ